MSEVHVDFSLDRAVSISNQIDAQGRKWGIHSSRQYPGLVWARPDPDRVDAEIPKQMYGKWTSKDRLNKQIDAYLTASWNKADIANKKVERATAAAKEQQKAIAALEKEEASKPKLTEEESLASLPAEVKELLGDTLALKSDKPEPVAKKKSVAKKKAT